MQSADLDLALEALPGFLLLHIEQIAAEFLDGHPAAAGRLLLRQIDAAEVTLADERHDAILIEECLPDIQCHLQPLPRRRT